MKKKTLLIIALILVAVFVLAGCTANVKGNGEILNGTFESGNFESKNVDKILSDWKVFKDDTLKSAVYSPVFKDVDPNSDDVAFANGKYLELDVSGDYGVYQYRQAIKLEKGVVYKLSYSVNILDNFSNYSSSNKVGMFVGILDGSDNKEFYNSAKTEGWTLRTNYITVDNNGSYTFAAGIGLENDRGARGRARLDNIKIEVVESAPAGIEPVSIASIGTSDGNTAGILYTVFLSLFAVIACVFAYYMIRRNYYKSTLESNLTPSGSSDGDKPILTGKQKAKKIFSSSYFIFTASLIGMFLIRFLLAFFTNGMVGDLTEMGELALRIQDVGLNGVYASTALPIPYGMMYLLGAIGGIADLAGLQASSSGMLMLLRLPQILADLVTFYLIFTLVGKTLGYKQGAIVAGLFAVLPSVFSLSATWGMNASLPLAFIVGAVFCMVSKNYWGTIACFTFAVIFNVYALIMLPVVVLFLAYYMWKEKSVRLYVLLPLAFIGAIVAYYLLALPFTIDFVKAGKFFFVFEKMGTILASNVLMSNSTFSFYAIFALGNNAVTTATKVVTGVLMCVFIVGLSYMYLNSRNRLDWIGVTATSFMVYSFFGVGASMDMALIGTVLMLIYAVMRDDKRLYKSFGIFSTLNFINIGAMVVSCGLLGNLSDFQALYKTDWLYILGSILTLFGMIYYIISLYDIMVNDYTYEIAPMSSFKQEMLDVKSNIGEKFNKVFRIKK